eukprot:scaffold109394_cov34-Prasinocladus_malaysianus.AAC.1
MLLHVHNVCQSHEIDDSLRCVIGIDFFMWNVCSKYDFPPDFPTPARDLVERLLVIDQNSRIGAADLSELKVNSKQPSGQS